MHHTMDTGQMIPTELVPISGSSDYAYGYDVMMAKKSVTSWDTIWKS